MPRGEPSIGVDEFGQPNLSGRISTKTSTSIPKANRSSTNPRFTDPLSGRRYSNRIGGLINPALLRARKGKSLIGTRIDKNLTSLISAFDTLKINT